jgi:hypothetical protein
MVKLETSIQIGTMHIVASIMTLQDGAIYLLKVHLNLNAL